MGLEYKFVELSVVTDETIEEAVNAWVARGWLLDGIRFVTTEASRRPSMAFISFTREVFAPMTLPPEREGVDAARSGFAGPRGTFEDSAESIDQTAPRPKGPRLVKTDPDDEQG